MHLRQNYAILATLLQKKFVLVTKLECSCGKTFIPVAEILVEETKIAVTCQARVLI